MAIDTDLKDPTAEAGKPFFTAGLNMPF